MQNLERCAKDWVALFWTALWECLERRGKNTSLIETRTSILNSYPRQSKNAIQHNIDPGPTVALKWPFIPGEKTLASPPTSDHRISSNKRPSSNKRSLPQETPPWAKQANKRPPSPPLESFLQVFLSPCACKVRLRPLSVHSIFSPFFKMKILQNFSISSHYRPLEYASLD